ncbi:SRPBCC domain-containing protein [Sungkyunkwania multivorans]|uniref:SRPBCC domain-containing protein n=1 Tax=Sungkyunkwania multivorans TaxID=1173618 RepID=A0ABW3CUE6_9FLAO
MKKLSFESFTKRIHIKTSMEKLYWCWGTAEGITSWFLRKAEYTSPDGKNRSASEHIKKGDSYVWAWHNWDSEEKGSVLDANGIDLVAWSFAGDCIVTVTLEQKEKAILLSLVQSNIPVDEKSKLEIHHGCSNGWTFWMANIKAYLEHGILLNETEIDLRAYELSGYEFVNM